MNPSELLNRNVVLHGVALGRVVDVILEQERDQPIGLEVRCGDGEHRFLPMTAARAQEEGIQVESPLTLLEPAELKFYRARGRSLRSNSSTAS